VILWVIALNVATLALIALSAFRLRGDLHLDLHFDVEREDDGRFFAGARGIPGCLAYGATSKEAMRAAKVLALRVLADRLEHGEAVP
jgi:predicted RNase H-like HicB family nuclease